jgi:hypothetical protein
MSKNNKTSAMTSVVPLPSPFTLDFSGKNEIIVHFPGDDGKVSAFFGLNDQGKVHAMANAIGDILSQKYIFTEGLGLLHVSMEDAVSGLGCNVGYMRPAMFATCPGLHLPETLDDVPTEGLFEVKYDGIRFSSRYFVFKYPDNEEVEPDQFKRDRQWKDYSVHMKFDAFDRFAKAQRLGLSIRLFFGEDKTGQIEYIKSLWAIAQMGQMDVLRTEIAKHIEKKLIFGEMQRVGYLLAQKSAFEPEIDGLPRNGPQPKANPHDRLVKKMASLEGKIAMLDGSFVQQTELIGKKIRYWKTDSEPVIGTSPVIEKEGKYGLDTVVGVIARAGYLVEFVS